MGLLLRRLRILSPMQGATIRRDEHSGAVVVARIMRGGAADRSGECHQCRPGRDGGHHSPAFPFGHRTPFLLLSGLLFRICFAFWEWSWNSLLPKHSRNFNCLKISQVWSTLGVIRRAHVLAKPEDCGSKAYSMGLAGNS